MSAAFVDANETHHCWTEILELGHTSIILSPESLSLPSILHQFPNASGQMDDLADDSFHVCLKIPTNQSLVYQAILKNLNSKLFKQSFELEVARNEIRPEMIYFACCYHRNRTQNNHILNGEQEILTKCGDNIITWNQFVREIEFKIGISKKYGD